MSPRRLTAVVAVALFLPAAPVAAQVTLREGVTLRTLEVAAARDSNDPSALYELALGYWSKRRWDDVERTLDAALAIEPRNAPALLALAHLPFARRPRLWDEIDRGEVPPEWQPALVRYDRYTRMAFLVEPLVDLSIVGAVSPDPSSLLRGRPTMERQLRVGIANLQNGRYDQAYAWFDRVARNLGGEQDPSRIPDLVLWYRGLSAAHLNDLRTAITDFTRLSQLGDTMASSAGFVDRPLATYILAYLEEHVGRTDDAILTYQQALARDLSLWMAHVRLAKIHDDRAEWAEAIRERRLAIVGAPDDPSLLLDLGITLSRAGRPEEAVEPLAEARAKLARNYRVPYWQGLVALQLGHSTEAREAFTRFLSLVPRRYPDQIAEVRDRLRNLSAP